ncbi:hypothetical protein Tco_1561913 [Tanacetum coccineum]
MTSSLYHADVEFDIRVSGSFGSFFLDVLKSLSLEYEHVAINLTMLERGGGGGSVDVVLVVTVKLEGTFSLAMLSAQFYQER